MLGQATPSLNDAPGPNALDQSKEWERVTWEIEIASRALSKYSLAGLLPKLTLTVAGSSSVQKPLRICSF